MKTKIVATIGSEDSYKGGIYGLEGTQTGPDRINLDALVREFCSRGADLIRLNMAHIDTQDIRSVFSIVKAAIIGWEKQNVGKRVAVLADLPGPKIRFHLQQRVDFQVGEEFTVHFEKKVSTAHAATVYVDDKPLKRAMDGLDNRSETEDLTGNGRSGMQRDSFQTLMEQVKGNKRVLVLVGDGEVVMEVVSVNAAEAFITCKAVTVKESGLQGNKGFTLRGVHVDIPSFTAADQKKLDELIGADYAADREEDPVIAFVGLSFTQSANDVLRIKEHIESRLMNRYSMSKSTARLQAPSIIAKIETKLGCQNADHILDVADGIMVARGDLGLQMDIEEVPAIQKRLIRLCNKRGKPVITATEMLKSMTESIEPTRAEGTDVFNAILDGSDAVMMSEETASGRYPFHAIGKMRSIADHAERYYEMEGMNDDARRAANLHRYQDFLADEHDRIEKSIGRLQGTFNELTKRISQGKGSLKKLRWMREFYEEKLAIAARQATTNRITQATCTMSEAQEIKYIVAASRSGRTVRMISRLRPGVLVIGAAHDMVNTRKLAVSYGVKPLFVGKVPVEAGTEGLFDRCRQEVQKEPDLQRHLRKGDMIVFSAGDPLGKPGTTSLVQMREI